ncbi:unnamed protein product, partial [Phaeothamnion confervicola]
APPHHFSTLGSLAQDDISTTNNAQRKAIKEDLAKLFGRLAEKTLFLDDSSGACCHSGCDGCPFRYSFDVMQAGRPKWIPTYTLRCFEDGRSHAAAWHLGLFPASAASETTREDFAAIIPTLAFSMPMGPPGLIAVKDSAPSPAAVALLWERLADDGNRLSTDGMLAKLQSWSSDGQAVTWRDFERAI